MQGIVYDCEIVRAIPTKKTDLSDGLEYCKGWNDFKNMGISVICAAFLHSECTFIFTESHIREFQKLIYKVQCESGYICGFNSASFDDNLLRANGIAIATDFDLLREVRIAAYGSHRWEDQPKGHCYSLDAIARANGFAKTGSGELAPRLWQQGKHQEVIDYCMNDVIVTKKLILLFLAGKLIDPNTGDYLITLPT